ncbi:hypothetical protein GCM10022270_10780 [Terriglobus aquaticus]
MLAQLVATSRRNNASDWISGVLLYNGTAFAQVLEGPANAVESCLNRIQQDPRHSNLVVVSRNPIQRRLFSAWSMAYIDGASFRLLSESAIDLEAILATGKSQPGFVLNLLRDVMGTQGYA